MSAAASPVRPVTPLDTASPRRGVVVVCGEDGLRGRVRAWLVDYGIPCIEAERPSGLELGRGQHIVGWIRAGSRCAWPRMLGRHVWCLTVERDARFASPLVLSWPEDARAMMASIVELTDSPGQRPLADVVLEHRLHQSLRSAPVPLGRVRGRVSNRIAVLEGEIAWPGLCEAAARIATRLPGVAWVDTRSLRNTRLESGGPNDRDDAAHGAGTGSATRPAPSLRRPGSMGL